VTKKIIIIVSVIILILILIEIVALLHLKSTLKSYATYWKNTPKAGDYTYVALGDSAAQGIGASKPQYGYVGLIASDIEKQSGKTVRIVNLSVSGAKIEDVINKQIPELAQYKPNLVTIEIGANDVAGNYNHASFESEYNHLASLLPKNTVVGNMPYFGGRIRHNTQALDANKVIVSLAAKYGLKVADLQTATRQHNSILNYAPDYFHPSNRGYKNWAAAFLQVIKPAK
jgi:acyl-CoA thioesterase-1